MRIGRLPAVPARNSQVGIGVRSGTGNADRHDDPLGRPDRLGNGSEGLDHVVVVGPEVVLGCHDEAAGLGIQPRRPERERAVRQDMMLAGPHQLEVLDVALGSIVPDEGARAPELQVGFHPVGIVREDEEVGLRNPPQDLAAPRPHSRSWAARRSGDSSRSRPGGCAGIRRPWSGCAAGLPRPDPERLRGWRKSAAAPAAPPGRSGSRPSSRPDRARRAGSPGSRDRRAGCAPTTTPCVFAAAISCRGCRLRLQREPVEAVVVELVVAVGRRVQLQAHAQRVRTAPSEGVTGDLIAQSTHDSRNDHPSPLRAMTTAPRVRINRDAPANLREPEADRSIHPVDAPLPFGIHWARAKPCRVSSSSSGRSRITTSGKVSRPVRATMSRILAWASSSGSCPGRAGVQGQHQGHGLTGSKAWR